LGLKKAGA